MIGAGVTIPQQQQGDKTQRGSAGCESLVARPAETHRAARSSGSAWEWKRHRAP